LIGVNRSQNLYFDRFPPLQLFLSLQQKVVMIEPENPDVSLYHLSAVVHVVLVSEPQDLLIVT